MPLTPIPQSTLRSLIPALPSRLAQAQAGSPTVAVAELPSSLHKDVDIPRLDKLPRDRELTNLIERAVKDQLSEEEIQQLVQQLVEETGKLSKLVAGREFENRVPFTVNLSGRNLKLLRDESSTYDASGSPSRFYMVKDKVHAPGMSLAFYYNPNGATIIKFGRKIDKPTNVTPEWIELETLANGKQRLAFFNGQRQSSLPNSEYSPRGAANEIFRVNGFTKAQYILTA